MLMPRVIPCLDVRGGRVVKGVRFADLRDSGDPESLAASYEQQGADELVMLDVAATEEQRVAAVETVRRIRSVLSIPLTVGGGVDGAGRASQLLEAGADKIAVNTAAVLQPGLLAELARRFGSQCVVIAIDATRVQEARVQPARWEVVIRAGRARTGLDAVEWAGMATALGAGEILLTSLDRDGTRSGYDLALISAVRRAASTPVIASGGAGCEAHLLQALGAGADAVLAAGILHEGRASVDDIKRCLAERGVPVRLDLKSREQS